MVALVASLVLAGMALSAPPASAVPHHHEPGHQHHKLGGGPGPPPREPQVAHRLPCHYGEVDLPVGVLSSGEVTFGCYTVLTCGPGTLPQGGRCVPSAGRVADTSTPIFCGPGTHLQPGTTTCVPNRPRLPHAPVPCDLGPRATNSRGPQFRRRRPPPPASCPGNTTAPPAGPQCAATPNPAELALHGSSGSGGETSFSVNCSGLPSGEGVNFAMTASSGCTVTFDPATVDADFLGRVTSSAFASDNCQPGDYFVSVTEVNPPHGSWVIRETFVR